MIVVIPLLIIIIVLLLAIDGAMDNLVIFLSFIFTVVFTIAVWGGIALGVYALMQ